MVGLWLKLWGWRAGGHVQTYGDTASCTKKAVQLMEVIGHAIKGMAHRPQASGAADSLSRPVRRWVWELVKPDDSLA